MTVRGRHRRIILELMVSLDGFIQGPGGDIGRHDRFDELHLIVNPVICGRGKPLLGGLNHTLRFKLKRVKTLESGNVLLVYIPSSHS